MELSPGAGQEKGRQCEVGCGLQVAKQTFGHGFIPTAENSTAGGKGRRALSV